MTTPDTKNKIRVLDHSWHLAHQYDLMSALKDDCEFTWLIQHRRGYNNSVRDNMLEKLGVKKVPYYEKGKYDVVILHLDQQSVEDTLWDRGKGSLYRELNETITDIPKIVIIHGTPYYPEHFNDIELCKRFKKAVGDSTVLCNSKRARLQWAYGLKGAEKIVEGKKAEQVGIPINQITTIWHGINPDDFVDLSKEPRAVTMISAGGLDAYYDRPFLQAVKDLLTERSMHHCHITVDAKFNNFNEYKRFLGTSLVFFNPTLESPMPRARTEAMLSGACIVTTPHQDADEFIEHGKNGYLVPRKPKETADLIEALVLEYKTAVRVGQEGKKTALKLFTYDRYRKEWLHLLSNVCG